MVVLGSRLTREVIKNNKKKKTRNYRLDEVLRSHGKKNIYFQAVEPYINISFLLLAEPTTQKKTKKHTHKKNA